MYEVSFSNQSTSILSFLPKSVPQQGIVILLLTCSLDTIRTCIIDKIEYFLLLLNISLGTMNYFLPPQSEFKCQTEKNKIVKLQ